MQKLHAALASGQRLMLTGSNVAAFSYQGSWDGGCALHSAAMAIAMLGRLSHPLRLTWRRGGAEAKFWERAEPHYLSGITFDDLSTLIRGLDWGLRPIVFEGRQTHVIGFCEREMSRGWPVIVSWRERHRAQEHAVLVVGVEGRKKGRMFQAHTLLALDPAECEPSLTVYNARLTWTVPSRGSRDAQMRYVTASYRRLIVVTGAISIRAVRTPVGRKRKPP
ncbi:hypothetical protein [Trinickia symbiotica]|uniref:hypothetical protein n=1 Tax=Trinickia symbiotica TaxID=863227 RepID=UPI002158A246|nr:hypothetical protein [Trinickia symbiotica]